MKITLDDEVYDYNPEALTLKEMRALKEQAGLEITDVLTPRFNDPRVMTAIIWLCRVREGEKKLRYDDVDIPLAKVILQVDEPEPVPDANPSEAIPSPTDDGSPTEPAA